LFGSNVYTMSDTKRKDLKQNFQIRYWQAVWLSGCLARISENLTLSRS